LLPHRRPVGTVVIVGVEEVAVDAPGFVEDLRPLRARLHPHTHALQGQLALALRQLVGDIGDEPVAAAGPGDALAIAREMEALDTAGHGLDLAVGQPEALELAGAPEGGEGGVATRLDEPDFAAGTHTQAVARARACRQGDDAVADALGIDAHDRRGLLLLATIPVLAAVVATALRGDGHLVALRRH